MINVLPYYPKYSYLDEMLSRTTRSKLYIHIDQKNVFSSIYSEWAIKHMLEETKRSRYIDLSIFNSFLDYVSFYKSYGKKRNLDIKFCFFSERGKSSYHTELHSKYKDRRRITDVFGIDEADSELFGRILSRNWNLIHKVGNKIPNVAIARLDFLEADFVPYYVMNDYLEDSEEWLHLICSSDKDMLQCLTQENRYQFIRKPNEHRIIGHEDALPYLLKTKEQLPIGAEYVPLALAIIGDSSDGYEGITGIAEKTFLKIIPDLMQITDDMKALSDRALKGEKLFPGECRTNNKYVRKIVENQDIIARNLKLASYRCLSNFLEETIYTNARKKMKDLRDILSMGSSRIRNPRVVLESFDKVGISLSISEEKLANIFEG